MGFGIGSLRLKLFNMLEQDRGGSEIGQNWMYALVSSNMLE